MRTLPRALAGWADLLAPFSPEVSDALGPWLPLLETLRGSVALPQTHPEGEPDGFSGLGRRGPYDRLLMSEWAVLEDAPDEFVRRAGTGEHLFHALARVQSKGAGRVVALFDAGPWQLGAPRLAHLAWLLVLARHAGAQGLRLAWGVLQAPDGGLREGVEVADLRALLGARTDEPAAPSMVEGWAARLGAPANGEERWVVSRAADANVATALNAHALTVAEEDDPRASALLLEGRSAAALRHPVRLALPARVTCGEILRDPARREPRARAAGDVVAPGAQLAFATTSPHVLARLVSGDLVALFFEGAAARSVRSPEPLARFAPPPGEAIVAAGWRKGKMCVLTLSDDFLILHRSQGGRWLRPREIPLGRAYDGAPDVSPGALGRLVIQADGQRMWFGDERWRLYEADVNVNAVHRVAEPVIAWGATPAGGETAFVHRHPGGALELHGAPQRGAASALLTPGEHRLSQGHIAFARGGELATFVALGAGDGTWHTFSRPFPPNRPWGETAGIERLSAEVPVYGAVDLGGAKCLVARAPSGDCLHLIAQGSLVMTVRFPGEIQHASVHANGHWFAAQIGDGVCVVDRKGRERMRWGGSLS